MTLAAPSHRPPTGAAGGDQLSPTSLSVLLRTRATERSWTKSSQNTLGVSQPLLLLEDNVGRLREHRTERPEGRGVLPSLILSPGSADPARIVRPPGSLGHHGHGACTPPGMAP